MSSHDDLDAVGVAYLEHLTDADLGTLVAADDVPAPARERRIAALRSQPALVLDVLDRPRTADQVLNLTGGNPADERFVFVSPFLVFAAAVHRTAADLAARTYRVERAGGRMRVPVFDSANLAAYLDLPWRRFFLAELLASYARVSSGVMWTQTSRGWRRRRWNDLDPMRLAMLLEAVPESEKSGVWRRLGDAALFLGGVFPDHALRAGLGADPARLARLTGLGESESPPEGTDGLMMLEWFGARWYELAARRAAFATSAVRLLQDHAEHFRDARGILNTTADRYLFPVASDWFAPPAA
jgi:hypothetical protein